MTRAAIIREYHRLCSIVNEAEQHMVTHDDGEQSCLLSVEEAQEMRDRYRERADVVLDVYRAQEKVRS